MSKEDGRKEREARSLALERAYVHDVYDQISNQFSHSVYRAWPRVAQFLEDLEPGSLVADIGCGNGKYLKVNTKTYNIGVDRCSSLANRAQENGNQVMLSDNTCLPFRDNGFDACISIAVIHHFATTERRVCALRELARILKIGGRLMITVWAMEQSQRKFESQDVLVPWHRPSLTDEKSSSIDKENIYATPDEERLQYRAYLPSDPCCSPKYENRKSVRRRKRSRGESVDSGGEEIPYAEFLLPGLGSYSPQGSEVTSPKESCYSFVRRALQKLTSSRRGSNGKSLLAATKGLSNLSSCNEEYIIDTIKNAERKFHLAYSLSTDSQDNIDDVPIELRQLEPDDPNLLDIPPTSISPINSDAKLDSKSMSLSEYATNQSVSPAILSETISSLLGSRILIDSESSTTESISNVLRSKSSSSCLSLSSRTNISSPVSASGISIMSSDSAKGNDSRSTDSGVDEESFRIGRKRPILKKQKESINEMETSLIIGLNKVRKTTEPNPVPTDSKDVECATIPKPSIVKQTSLNDEIIYIDRFIANEKIKQSVQKQCSLNEDLIYGNAENSDIPLRQRLFNSQYGYFQAIRDRFQKLRVASLDRFEKESSDSFKSGILKLLQSWKSELIIPEYRQSGSNSKRTYFASPDFLESINRGKLYFESKFKNSYTNSASDSDKNLDENNLILKREFSERKSSREESSDSSKESSFQSDTSLDSEDSCISVIFVPKPDQGSAILKDKERNRSVSSESSEGSDMPNSPKSPKSPKSPGSSSSRNEDVNKKRRQPVKKTMPKYLTFEIFNPETDDLDSDSSSSSSPQSGSSVIELGWPTAKEIEELDKEIKRKEEEEEKNKQERAEFCGEEYLEPEQIPKLSLVEPVHRMDTINEETCNAEINQYHIIRRIQSGLYQFPKEYHTAIKRLDPTPVVGKIESLKVKQTDERQSKPLHPLLSSIPKSVVPICPIKNTFSTKIVAPENIKTTNKMNLSMLGDSKKGMTPILRTQKHTEYIQQNKGSIGEDLKENTKVVISKPLPVTSSGYSSASVAYVTPSNKFSSSNTKFSKNNSKEAVFLAKFPRTGNFKEVDKSGSDLVIDSCEDEGTANVTGSEIKITGNQMREHAAKAGMIKTVNKVECKRSKCSPRYTAPTIPSSNFNDTSIPFKLPVKESGKTYASMRSSIINDQVNINKKIIQMYRKDDIWSKESKEGNQRTSCESCKRLHEKNLRSIVSEWQDPTSQKIIEKTTAERRKTLRQQSSLDSAQERRDFYCRGRMKLSRSGSLDLSSSSRSSKSLSKDDSLSTSQDSLQSDMGGAPTLHRYYHVFKEGELDQIIEKYVHNLHIISSYYDHANWCIIAEKVQVWTI